MKVQSGTYTGTGSGFAITGVGFQPKAVLIKGVSFQAVWCFDSMGADATKDLGVTGAIFSGGVVSLDAGGFTIGTDTRVNNNTTVYRWLALAHDGVNNDLETGSFAGNSTDNTNISLAVITGTPTAVFIAPSDAQDLEMRTDDHSGDNAQGFSRAVLANIIQSFGAGTFQVGNRSATPTMNRTGVTYYWLALVDSANQFKAMTYTPDGTDNYDVTGVGFQPDTLWTKRTNSTNAAGLRFKTHVGDSSTDLGAGGDAANIIQSVASDGFQVGTNASANVSGVPYVVCAFKDPAAAATNHNSLLLLGVG